jgi:RNA polymerase sigma-70 factor (ECF subfamily)
MAEYKNLPDLELVSLIKTDDKLAFGEFFNRYKGPLFLHAFKMLKDDEDAKDVVQELLIRIWDTRHTLTIKSTVEAYVHQSVRYKVYDFMRRRKVISGYLDSLEHYLEKGTAALDENYIEKETLTLFKKEVEMLPERMREVFDLSRNQGLTNKQIAEKMSISENTVKKQINKAIKIIRLKINFSLFSLLFL